MRRVIPIPSLDPFLLILIATIALASLFPARGGATYFFDIATQFAIALLFFLHGAKLSREAIMQGIGNWRLHALVLASTYVLFPVIGLALTTLETGWASPQFATGLLFLSILPSTVQSSIAFTAMARGNVAAAVCSASLSNLLGIFATPLLLGLLGHIAGHITGQGVGASWGAVRTIGLQLLLPFVAGHLLRPVIGGFVQRNKRILGPVDRSSILLVVYTAFSAAVVGGIWHHIGLGDMAVLLGNCAVVLALVMGVNVAVARLVKLPREDAIVLLFCGSKKSLVSGRADGRRIVPGSAGRADRAAADAVPPAAIVRLRDLGWPSLAASRLQTLRSALPLSPAKPLKRRRRVAAALGLTIPAQLPARRHRQSRSPRPSCRHLSEAPAP